MNPIDIHDPSFVAVYDELPLWSALSGSLLLDHIPMRCPSRLLDVGCGTGFPLLELAQRFGDGCRATGLDVWSQGMARSRQKVERLGLGNVDLVAGDAAAMPFEDGTFDLVVTNLGLNNFADPDAAMAEVRRVSRPGACLALATNARGHMHQLYEVLEQVLRSNAVDGGLERLTEHVEHRPTVETLTSLVSKHGFTVVQSVEHQATMRFPDGSALLRPHFIRLGLLDGWNAVMGQSRDMLASLEAALNEASRRAGELRLTIPLIYLEARC